MARSVLGGDRQAAEDVVQEAFLALWRRGGSFDPRRGSVRTWLAGIVRNQAIDALRREASKARRAALADRLLDARADGDCVAEAVETSHRALAVREALARLPSEQQRVITLNYFHDLPQSAIAHACGMPLGTVKSRSRRALDQLRLDLGPRLGEAAA